MSSPEAPTFQPAECIDSDTCLYLGKCYKAVLIRREASYQREGLARNGLKSQIVLECCGHDEENNAIAEVYNEFPGLIGSILSENSIYYLG